MGTEDTMGDEVYQPDPSTDREVREDHGLLDNEDTLMDRPADPYDEGYSPPERPWGVDHHGTTAREQRERETLDQRLGEELPDPALIPEDGENVPDGIGDLPGGMGEPYDAEVGNRRAGRIVALDEGAHPNTDSDVLARDVGVNGGAASAEEAAMHVILADGEE